MHPPLPSLPPELIHLIALSGNLTYSDVSSLALTCTSLASTLHHDPYARDLHSALLGVLPNVRAKRWVPARYALKRRWIGTPDSELTASENNLWKVLVEMIAACGWKHHVHPNNSNDVEEWESLTLAALALPNAAGYDTHFKTRFDNSCTTLLNIAAEVGASRLVKWGIESANLAVDMTNFVFLRRPLHTAAANGHAELVSYLLEHGADLEGVVLNGDSPLAMAVTSGHADVVRLLLDHGAKVNAGFYLHRACDCEHTHIARLLLDHGADVNRRGRGGLTPLMIATLTNNLELVQLLVSHPETDLTLADDDGNSPLCVASDRGYVQIIRTLLAHNADVNKPSRDTTAPLTRACRYGHMDAARVLVEAGANLDAQDKDGFTALSIACIRSHFDLAAYLLEAGADVKLMSPLKDSLLVYACDEGNHGLVVFCLDHDADPNAPEAEEGYTPLYMASWCGYTDIIRTLLSRNADVNLAPEGFCSPLAIACKSQNVDAARLLIQAGADITPQGSFPPPLIMACLKNDPEIAQLLVSAGASVTEPWSGMPPLVWSEGVEVAAYLLSMGADLDARTDEGMTFLGIACDTERPDLVTFCLSRGANPNATSHTGITPLNIVTRSGHTSMVIALLNHGANPSQSDLHVAISCNHLGVVRTLIESGTVVVDPLALDLAQAGGIDLSQMAPAPSPA